MKYLYKEQHLTCTLALTIILAIYGCETAPNKASTEAHEEAEVTSVVELTPAQFEQANIGLSKPEKRMMGAQLPVNGIIDVPPQGNVSIGVPYGGFVRFTQMLPGTPVKKGQLLVTIENPEFIQFQQDYLVNIANREFLRAEYERQQRLFEENVASAKNFQQSKSSFLANEARIASLKAKLKLIGFNMDRIEAGKIAASVNLYSPVNGYIREVYANTGKFVHPQDVIMSITDREDLHVELTVYENDIPKVKKGQPIRFTIANSPESWREAEVFLIGSGVREDRSVTVHGHLKEHFEDLLPGMYVTARINTELSEYWTVPEEAVVRFAGAHYVFISKGQESNGNHIFQMTRVTKGLSENGYTAITIPDNPNMNELNLVTSGAFTVLAKAKNTEEDEGGHGH